MPESEYSMMKKEEMTKVETTVESTQETVVQAQSAPDQKVPAVSAVEFTVKRTNVRDCTLTDKAFNIRLSNIKDHNYFKRGLAYFNFVSIITAIESEKKKQDEAITKVKASDPKYTENPQFIGLKERLSELATFQTSIDKMRQNYNFTDEEQAEFKQDNFMKLTASVLFKMDDDKIALPFMDEVIATLKVFSEVATLEKANKKYSDAFKALKEQLNNMASLYNTKDGERYKNSELKVNSTMVMDVYRIGYAGCKPDKDGNFKRTDANVKKLKHEIIAQFTGRLQGSIKNEA